MSPLPRYLAGMPARTHHWIGGLFVILALGLACTAIFIPREAGGEERNYVNSELPWHDAVVDSHGKLLAWYHPERNQGYDKVLHLAWDFMEHKIPNDAKSGLKVYLVNAVYDAKMLQGTNWQGNPASTFGQFVDSLVAWYPYSGDQEAIPLVRSMLDHQLAHGTSPAAWAWPKVPFPTNLKNDPEYGKNIRGMPANFYGGIETDKVGEPGIGDVLFYELTGERKYPLIYGPIRCLALLEACGPLPPPPARRNSWAYAC